MVPNAKRVSMINPLSGEREVYRSDVCIEDLLKCIEEVFSPAGYYNFLIDGIPLDDISIEIPPSDPEVG